MPPLIYFIIFFFYEQTNSFFLRKRKKQLEVEYAKYCDEIVKYWKKFEHGKIKVDWEDIDKIAEKTARFISRMEKLVEDIEK